MHGLKRFSLRRSLQRFGWLQNGLEDDRLPQRTGVSQRSTGGCKGHHPPWLSRSFQPSGRTLAFHRLKLTRSFFDKGRRSIQVGFGGSGRSHFGRRSPAGPCSRRLGQRRRNHCGCLGSFIDHLANLGSLGNLAQFILKSLKKTGRLRGRRGLRILPVAIGSG